MIFSLQMHSQASLYHAFTKETVDINGENFQSKINRIVSLDVEAVNSMKYHFNIEMFRRTQEAWHMSQTEKDLWNDLAYIYDKVDFLVDDTGRPMSFSNYDEIIKKQQTVIDGIKQSYKGVEIDSLIKQITFAGRDNPILAAHLLQYKMYGLFFMGLYGQVYNHSRKKKYHAILGTSGFIIKEHFLQSQNDGIVTYNIKGEIDHINIEEWKNEANRIGIYIEANQNPILDSYEGIYKINSYTSEIEEVKIQLSVSYGNFFKKQLLYSLLLLSDDEIEDLSDEIED